MESNEVPHSYGKEIYLAKVGSEIYPDFSACKFFSNHPDLLQMPTYRDGHLGVNAGPSPKIYKIITDRFGVVESIINTATGEISSLVSYFHDSIPKSINVGKPLLVSQALINRK